MYREIVERSGLRVWDGSDVDGVDRGTGWVLAELGLSVFFFQLGMVGVMSSSSCVGASYQTS